GKPAAPQAFAILLDDVANATVDQPSLPLNSRTATVPLGSPKSDTQDTVPPQPKRPVKQATDTEQPLVPLPIIAALTPVQAQEVTKVQAQPAKSVVSGDKKAPTVSDAAETSIFGSAPQVQPPADLHASVDRALGRRVEEKSIPDSIAPHLHKHIAKPQEDLNAIQEDAGGASTNPSPSIDAFRPTVAVRFENPVKAPPPAETNTSADSNQTVAAALAAVPSFAPLKPVGGDRQ